MDAMVAHHFISTCEVGSVHEFKIVFIIARACLEEMNELEVGHKVKLCLFIEDELVFLDSFKELRTKEQELINKHRLRLNSGITLRCRVSVMGI